MLKKNIIIFMSFASILIGRSEPKNTFSEIYLNKIDQEINHHDQKTITTAPQNTNHGRFFFGPDPHKQNTPKKISAPAAPKKNSAPAAPK